MLWGMNRSSAEGWLGDGVGIEGDVIPHLYFLARLAGRAVRNEIARRIRHLQADSRNKRQQIVTPYVGLRNPVTYETRKGLSRGVSRVATKKVEPKLEQKLKTPSPKEKLKIKTKGTESDWYESAYKRFSITLNRANEKNHPLAKLSPLIKPGLQQRRVDVKL
jgi:hypothetical protein